MNIFVYDENTPAQAKKQAGREFFCRFLLAVLSHPFMNHRMGALNARAFLKKLVTHVLIMRKTSNGLWMDSF